MRYHLDNIYRNKQIIKQITMHELAIELMEELDEKYNMTNTLSLDEYLCEYSEDILTIDEINECKNILYTNVN